MNLKTFKGKSLDMLWNHMQGKKYQFGVSSPLAKRIDKIQTKIEKEEIRRRYDD